MDSSSASNGTRQVLALAGGGFLGLYTAALLEALEVRAQRPLARHFDLLAGTSIGAVLALALAFELPMRRLVQLITEHGPEVFSHRPMPASTVGRLLDLSRSVLGPKYSGARLREALQSEFGDLRLGDALHPVVVPAVDIGTCRAKIFKTPHAPDSVGDADLKALDVALAACAAPAYFPSVRIGSRLYADGGLFAVAPDQVALHELEYFVGIVPARVAMLSIGTAAAHYQPSEGLNEGAGAVGWLTDGRLLMTLISVQQQHVQAMMEDRLGERYVHLDAEWPVDGGLGIDVATPEAAKRLKAMARATLSAEVEQQVSGFFDHLGSTSHFAPSPAQDR